MRLRGTFGRCSVVTGGGGIVEGCGLETRDVERGGEAAMILRDEAVGALETPPG